MNPNRDAFKRAIEIAGGQNALARKIGTNQPSIWHWLNKTQRGVPAEWVAAVSEVTGVSKRELRPDLFGDDRDEGAPPRICAICGQPRGLHDFAVALKNLGIEGRSAHPKCVSIAKMVVAKRNPSA